MHGWKFPLLLGLLLAVAAVGGGGNPQPAHAATTRVWIGAATSDFWSAPANWSPTGAPVDGDSVVVPAATTGIGQKNDLGSFNIITNKFEPLRLSSLTLNQAVSLRGNRLAITSTLSVGVSSIVTELEFPLELAGNVQVAVAPSSRLSLSPGGWAAGKVAVDTAGHNLTKTGLGTLEVHADLVGNGTFAVNGGATMVRQQYPVTFGGTIAIGPGASLTFVPGPLTSTGVVSQCGASNAAVVLSGANLSAQCPASVGSVAGTGSIDVGGEVPRLTITLTGETFEGVISGGSAATFTCCGQGVQTLRGASTFTGNVLVKSGGLYLEGATFPSASRFTVQGKGAFPATLGGYGAFGATTMTTAVLDLASVNGNFGLARFPTLQFAPDVEVYYELSGPTPGSGFTQILMTGQLVLDSALLNLYFAGYTPAIGQAITLVKGAKALLDTFHNFDDGKDLPEGSTFTTSGMQFKITYTAGAGHDVVITRVAGTPPGPAKFKRFVPMVARDS